ncbi:MAG: hypothetical protein EPO13_04085 [Actinomycetota bacterium]|nr:MAG: hypothetical protein EPO13_04085 [Actinomycetota bacterium]
MSSVLNPVGPEPPGVYWRRRALLVIVLLLLVLLIWWLFFKPAGGSPAATPAPSGSPSASAVTSPSPSSTAKPSASPSASVPTSPSQSPAEPGNCAPADIAVTATTDAASYKVGSTPKLTLRVTNSSATACKRDVGQKANEIVVSSGGVKVWSSDDCGSTSGTDVVTLQPGQSYSTTVTWDGRLTGPTCSTAGKVAQAGSYAVVARNGDVTSKATPFALTAA